MTNRLYRSRSERMIGGVCGGFGAYFGIDPVIVRLVFVALTIWGGMGILAYIILWIVIPPEERLGVSQQDAIHGNVSEIEHSAQEFAQQARDMFNGESGTVVPRDRTILAAVVLIILGGVLLVGNIFAIPFDRLWPAVLILLGLYMIYRAVVKR